MPLHPPPPPGAPGDPPPPPNWAGFDQMKDEEVLRFAPPEIRRVWKRLLSVETQVVEIRDTLKRIEDLLRAKSGAA